MTAKIGPIPPPHLPRFRIDLPDWANIVMNAGIVSADPRIRRRQRFTNVAAYALGLNAATHLVANILYDFWALAPVNIYNVLVAALYFSLYRLHRAGQNVAANALIVISLVGHSYVVFAFGLRSDLHVYFTLAGFILFLVGVEHWRNFLLLYALSVAALIAAMSFASENGFVLTADEAFRHRLAFQAMLSAVILNAGVIAFILASLDSAERNLQNEYERSELLLTTILPATIAERLKSGRERRIADRLDSVTILFADLVGFTPAAAASTPEEVVRYLDRLFSRFDALCEKHGVDKIKTIGDAYMAVGGLRNTISDGAEEVGRLALDILATVESERLAGRPLSIRVGIHHGPAVAGVIGERRMTFDVWGDTVNIAARLESSGLPGTIQASEAYRNAVAPHFAFTPRGTVELKGLGRRPTYIMNPG